MDEFCTRCNRKNRRFTGGKSRFLQEADWVKFAADVAAELCGIALKMRGYCFGGIRVFFTVAKCGKKE